MLEEEWLACTEPTPMLDYLQGRTNGRKLRLFALSSFRRVPELDAAKWKRDLDIIERHIEGEAGKREITPLLKMLLVGPVHARLALLLARTGDEHRAASMAVRLATIMSISITSERSYERSQEVPVQVSLVRDIFGNPFRPVTVDPSWLTSDVIALATGIYDDRAFDRLLILADALQDAGCENEGILSHCRDANGVHVRGCWVVDLLLGKS